jgi:hypothetical protein
VSLLNFPTITLALTKESVNPESPYSSKYSKPSDELWPNLHAWWDFVLAYRQHLLLTKHHTKQLSKGKAVPLQAWTGPEGSRRLRLSDFKTIGI